MSGPSDSSLPADQKKFSSRRLYFDFDWSEELDRTPKQDCGGNYNLWDESKGGSVNK